MTPLLGENGSVVGVVVSKLNAMEDSRCDPRLRQHDRASIADAVKGRS